MCFLVKVLGSVVHDGHEGQPCLPGSGDDLAGGQHEAVASRVAELKGERVLDPLIVRPVDGSATGLVCNPGQNEMVSVDLKSNIARVLTAQSLLLSGYIEWNCTGPMRKRTHRWY